MLEPSISARAAPMKNNTNNITSASAAMSFDFMAVPISMDGHKKSVRLLAADGNEGAKCAHLIFGPRTQSRIPRPIEDRQRCSGDSLPPSPPAEKTTASQD